METIYELIKKNSDGRGEDVMWKTVRIVSDAVEKSMTPEEKHCLMRSIYGEMSDGHYNEMFAKEDVKKMYYTDEAGTKHYGPYWPEEAVKEVYESVSGSVPDEYNFWDFYVTLQMIKSDVGPLYKKWFPADTPEEITKRYVESAVNWLADEDNPYGSKKIWSYLNK